MKHKLLKPAVAFILMFIFRAGTGIASGLEITDFKINETGTLYCTVSWNHAWSASGGEAPGNHDAVWVFVKYRTGDSFMHLKITEGDIQVSGAAVATRIDKDSLGVLIRTAGTGAPIDQVATIEITPRWPADPATAEWRIFALEMVYIPEGPFYVGDSVSNSTLADGGTCLPYLIASENAIPAGQSTGNLWANGSIVPSSLSNNYPKGYAGFYCMKYEISQIQYADFLNSLNYTQQAARMMANPASAPGTSAFIAANRHGLKISQSGTESSKPAVIACDGNGNSVYNEAGDGLHRACNFLSGDDVAAYLEWAGLSPLTETEFEKAARGPEYPTKKEFAWSTELIKNAVTMTEDGQKTERPGFTVIGDTGVAVHGALVSDPFLKGPARTGFAAGSETNRTSAGAGYYGCMELSGNLWEAVITIGETGAGYSGQRGKGMLNSDGVAPTLPAGDAFTWKGGGWNSLVTNNMNYQFRDLAISDRVYGNLTAQQRRATSGGRGVLREIHLQ